MIIMCVCRPSPYAPAAANNLIIFISLYYYIMLIMCVERLHAHRPVERYIIMGRNTSIILQHHNIISQPSMISIGRDDTRCVWSVSARTRSWKEGAAKRTNG